MEKFLKDNNIEQVYISNVLNINDSSIFKNININGYKSANKNTLFFGMYKIEDYKILKKHKGKKWILWGGNDADVTNVRRIKFMKNMENIEKHIAHTDNIYKNLKYIFKEDNLIKLSNLKDLKINDRIRDQIIDLIKISIIKNYELIKELNTIELHFKNDNDMNLIVKNFYYFKSYFLCHKKFPNQYLNDNINIDINFKNLINSEFYINYINNLENKLLDQTVLKKYISSKLNDIKLEYSNNFKYTKKYNLAKWNKTSKKYITDSDNKIFYESMKEYNKINKLKKESLAMPGEKLLTLIMIIKNREKRATISMLSILNSTNYHKYCNFMVVEDNSDNNLDLKKIKNNYLIDYYLVNTNVRWTRSGLLNYGINKCKTKYFLAWDSDFLFSDDFLVKLNSLLYWHPKNTIALNLFETEISNFHMDRLSFNLPLCPYSQCWIYNTQVVKDVGYFSINFIGWGGEEKELENRIEEKMNLKTINIRDPELFVLHLSHNDNLRSSSTNPNNDLIINKINCEKYKNNTDNFVNYELIKKTNKKLFIIGNGPSGKAIIKYGINNLIKILKKNDFDIVCCNKILYYFDTVDMDVFPDFYVAGDAMINTNIIEKISQYEDKFKQIFMSIPYIENELIYKVKDLDLHPNKLIELNKNLSQENINKLFNEKRNKFNYTIINHTNTGLFCLKDIYTYDEIYAIGLDETYSYADKEKTTIEIVKKKSYIQNTDYFFKSSLTNLVSNVGKDRIIQMNKIINKFKFYNLSTESLLDGNKQYNFDTFIDTLIQ